MSKKSIASTDSKVSVDSVGIGNPIGAKLAEDDEIARLYPEGPIPTGQAVYDCIVYLIYCSVHDRICVTNVDKSKVVWLPFVALSEGATWEKASLDGVAMLIGRKDSELDAKLMASKLPKFQMINLHLLRIQLPNERFITRLGQFVNIEPTNGFKCCEKTNRLEWIPAADIIQDRVACLWGPEVKLFTTMLLPPEPKKFIYEYSLDSLLTFVGQKGNYQERLLTKSGISTEKVMFMYEDYVEHCFPAFYMSPESFKSFLVRYGFPKNDNRFMWLFNAIGYSRKGYLDFHELLIGIVCMEPNTEHGEARIRLLFRYYDIDCDNNISVTEFLRMMHDLNPNTPPEQLKENMDDCKKKFNFIDDKLNFEAFFKGMQLKLSYLKNSASLGRSSKAVIPQIEATVMGRHKMQEEKREEKNRSDKKRKDRGICDGCRAQTYEYGQHFVTIDASGRCIRSLEMKNVEKEEKMTLRRYSAEIVFHIDSICNLFVDQFRDLCYKNGTTNTFQMAEENGGKNFDRYIRSLCQYVGELFVAEEKMMHINAPAYVFGDLAGSWEILSSLERVFWPSMPIFYDNLVFLGNYIDPNSRHNMEVICYLFALKMIAPNKILMLRGNKESQANCKFLLAECQHKFGKLGDQIWDWINDAFNRMPYALVIDESIICVHSGIPKSVNRLTKFLGIPEVVKNVEKESQLAHELMNNVPHEEIVRSVEDAPRFEFSGDMFENFMKVNRLNYLIRGEEQCNEGYRLYFNGRCITITTNDKLGGSPAVVFVDGCDVDIKIVKIEIVKVNTEEMSAKIQNRINSKNITENKTMKR